MEINRNEIGTYKIQNNAFKDIAAIAANKIKNIYPVGKKDNDFVACKIDKNNIMTITLSLRVKQGIDVVKLCNEIQDSVHDNILLMTGVDCQNINIDILGFEKDK